MNRTYVNFNNQASPEEIARVQIGDELGTDFIFDALRTIFPKLIDGMYETAKSAGLPPRGRRCICITAGTTFNFMAAQHEENTNDPIWTLGGCFQRATIFTPSDFSFAHPGLHGGRGVIMRGSRRYLWMWKGSVNVHGGVVSKKTVGTVENNDPLDDCYLAIAAYQKRQPLNFGHRYLRGPPTDSKVWCKNVNMQNSRHALGWMGCV